MELFIKFLSQIVDAVRYNFSLRILNLKITRIELERFESTIVDGLPNTFKKDFKMSRRIGARLCSTNHTAALQPLVSRSLIESDILYRVNFNLDSHHSLSLSFSPSFSVQSRLSRSLTRFLDILPLQRLLPLWMETFVSNRFAPLRQNNLYSFVRSLFDSDSYLNSLLIRQQLCRSKILSPFSLFLLSENAMVHARSQLLRYFLSAVGVGRFAPLPTPLPTSK